MLIYELLPFFAYLFEPTQGVYEEVCMWKTFAVNCSDDEVIVIDKAIYGQASNSSRCENFTIETGSCSIDVITSFDRNCGGRQECKVAIPNKDLSDRLKGLSCKSHRNLYLAISYNCVYVYSAPGESCANKSLTVLSAVGHLSSIVSADTKKGSSMCPWKFRLNRDQSIRFSLLDFDTEQSRKLPDQETVCRIYATFHLRHDSGEIYRSVLCGGDMRQINLPIDVSTATEVDVALTNQNSQEDDVTSFLIRYEVFTLCPEYIPPENASVTKTNNGQRVTCLNSADTSWLLECVDGRWIPEPNKSCDDSISAGSNSSSLDYGIHPKWLLTCWPAGIVLLIVILVSVGVVWRIRTKRRQAANTSNSCSSEHHYSDVDVDQFIPEMIMDRPIIVEAPVAPVLQVDSTTPTAYSNLKRPLAIPIPVVYSDLQIDDLMVEDVNHIDADDPSATMVLLMTSPYANEVRQ